MTSDTNALRVAIVGSGPSAFFCADYLLRLARPCRVSMFERMPYPFGMLRDGIAPDHSNIRNASRAFTRLLMRQECAFFGNVTVGQDISPVTLLRHHHAVIIATGARRPRYPGIEGEQLRGCIDGASFAAWYNGGLDGITLRPELNTPAAVVIGAGNVALDAARMLVTPPELFSATDIAGTALSALTDSKIRDVHVVARKSGLEARFSPQELEFLNAVEGIRVVLHHHTDQAHTPDNHPLLKAYARLEERARERSAAQRRLHLHFNLTPRAILGETDVTGALFNSTENTALHIPSGLVVFCLGQEGKVLPGAPFDEALGIVPNIGGRVIDESGLLPGLYTAGWIKRGAAGVIGANKPDCRQTVQAILEDRTELTARALPSENALLQELTRTTRVVSREHWLRMDEEELRRGAQSGKLRERFSSKEDMFAFLDL